MAVVNKELGKIFNDMSHIYQYKDGKQKFRAIAYEKASRVINDLQDVDLNDELAKLARENGVQLTISTDSHQQSQFAFMQLGVFIARKGWRTKNNILNTARWKDLETWARRKRKNKITHAIF